MASSKFSETLSPRFGASDGYLTFVSILLIESVLALVNPRFVAPNQDNIAC
ncbi:MAG: hypothetical protein AAGL69_14815 [Pseudomonadota bacterium]